MVAWSEIVAECGNYKQGFVAVFRRHEGEETDARDPQGRPLKVSANSFADHMGIPRETFKGWARAEAGGRTSADRARSTAVSHANVAKNLARRDPESLVDAIEQAGPHAMDDVHHELKLRRAGIDTSRSARKAAEASAHHQTEPIRRAMAAADIPLCIAALRDAREHLLSAIGAGALNDESMSAINAAHEDFQIALAEASLHLS